MKCRFILDDFSRFDSDVETNVEETRATTRIKRLYVTACIFGAKVTLASFVVLSPTKLQKCNILP